MVYIGVLGKFWKVYVFLLSSFMDIIAGMFPFLYL